MQYKVANWSKTMVKEYSRKSCFIVIVILTTFLLENISQANEVQWQRLRFNKTDDVVHYLHGINYSLNNWFAGDLSVPRVYPTRIPALWSSSYARQLTKSERKRYFVFILAPLVLRANEAVLEQRHFIQRLQQQNLWSKAESSKLTYLAEQYQVPAPINKGDAAAFSKLLRRVDIIPPSMALAQAALETAWGTSRFAKEGNALFGQWTWGENAMKPAHMRIGMGNYGVRAFKSPFESVTAYMLNLNRNKAYHLMRQLRAEARKKNTRLDGFTLAIGLEEYSEHGKTYVRSIQQLIKVHQLAKHDSDYFRNGDPVILEFVGDEV